MVSQLVGCLIWIFYSTRFLYFIFCCFYTHSRYVSWKQKCSERLCAAYLIWGAPRKRQRSYRNLYLGLFIYLFSYLRKRISNKSKFRRRQQFTNQLGNWNWESGIRRDGTRRGWAGRGASVELRPLSGPSYVNRGAIKEMQQQQTSSRDLKLTYANIDWLTDWLTHWHMM